MSIHQWTTPIFEDGIFDAAPNWESNTDFRPMYMLGKEWAVVRKDTILKCWSHELPVKAGQKIRVVKRGDPMTFALIEIE